MTVPPLKNKEDWVKLHCLRNLFSEVFGQDQEMLLQIKEAIDLTMAEDQALPPTLDTFAELAFHLLQDQPFSEASYGFFLLDLRGREWDPLFVRNELVRGLRRIAGYEASTLVVVGLREAVCPRGRYFTDRLRRRYDDALGYIDKLAFAWTTPETRLSLFYL